MPNLVLRWAFVGLLGTATIAPAVKAADSLPSGDAPDLTKVRRAIDAKNYNAALAELKALVVTYQQPDVYSLMGFVLRKTGDRPQAMTYYRKALDIDPRHKGALEYQGELYVELGQIDRAKENLAKLDGLCWFGCEEKDDLKAAIAHATKQK
jgi:tetratricopeptide (TPR) repeat protein